MWGEVMQIQLYPLNLQQMERRLAGAETLDGLHVTQEVIPDIILVLACTALRAGGQSSRWRRPYLFLTGNPPVAVGSAAFMSEPVQGRVEIGYGMASPYAGRGFATAGVRLLVQHAFSQPELDEIYAQTAIGNHGSRRVMEKLGFQHLGQGESEHDGRVDQWLLRRP
jgi:[ribosomal protein S5]-alanine N-acetyltransferase